MGRKLWPILLGTPSSASSYGHATGGSRSCSLAARFPQRCLRAASRSRQHWRAPSTSLRSPISSNSRRACAQTATLATAYLGLVRSDGELDGEWQLVRGPLRLGRDDAATVTAAQARLRAKLSYTNIGFALAPATFTISELRQVYVAALGHDVAATNLQRVLLRRGVLERIERPAPPGPRRRPPGSRLPLRVPAARSHGRVRHTATTPLTAGHAWQRPVPSPNQGDKSVTLLPQAFHSARKTQAAPDPFFVRPGCQDCDIRSTGRQRRPPGSRASG